MSVPEGVDREWNEWYSGEYVPGYRKVPGVIYARRYRIVEGETKYATVYEFEHEKVSETAEWNKQREGSSPRSGKMRDAMTHAPGSPGVYRRIYPCGAAAKAALRRLPEGRGGGRSLGVREGGGAGALARHSTATVIRLAAGSVLRAVTDGSHDVGNPNRDRSCSMGSL